MKIALITDTHFGARGDSQMMMSHQAQFFNQTFFPTIDERGIKHVIHLGDLVDRRKYINFNTSMSMKKAFFDPLAKRGIKADFICGNHDTYFKTTNSLNAYEEILGNYNVDVFIDPTEAVVDIPLLYIPWITVENEEATLAAIKTSRAEIVLGHLELSGFEMFRGAVAAHGMQPSIFDGFDQVFSGHFHQQSSKGNITYLGAPYQMTWSDAECDRGFHILDTVTRELEFVKNPLDMFVKMYYDDSDATLSEALDIGNLDLTGVYVKIIVKNKTNPYYFDQYVSMIERMGPSDVRIVEALTQQDVSQIASQAEDTQTILMHTIDELDMEVDKDKLKLLLRDLYTEALDIGIDA